MDGNIKIKTIQNIGGEQDVIEFCAPAEYYKKADKYYISYYEGERQSETRALIKIEENSFSVTRFGEINTVMRFEAGIVHLCNYQTAAGIIKIYINCGYLQINTDDNGGTIEADYTLSADEAGKDIISRNILHMELEA